MNVLLVRIGRAECENETLKHLKKPLKKGLKPENQCCPKLEMNFSEVNTKY
jgi:hypothetical protein